MIRQWSIVSLLATFLDWFEFRFRGAVPEPQLPEVSADVDADYIDHILRQDREDGVDGLVNRCLEADTRPQGRDQGECAGNIGQTQPQQVFLHDNRVLYPVEDVFEILHAYRPLVNCLVTCILYHNYTQKSREKYHS